MVQQGVNQGAAFAAGGRVDGHARRLVDDDQILVLEEHAERDGLGGRLGRRRRGDLQAVVAGLGLGRGVVQHDAVAADAALAHQRLDAAPGHLGQADGQDLVDAAFRLLGGDRHDADAERFRTVVFRIRDGLRGHASRRRPLRGEDLRSTSTVMLL